MTASIPPKIDLTNWRRYAASANAADLFTAVIPAAGRGSRLGFNRPKILFPVAGRMILQWLLDLLLPRCGHMILVLSPAGRSEVEKELDRLAPGRVRCLLQQTPTGMGDAVEIGLAAATTEHVAVVWGDQPALRPESVEVALRLAQGPLNPDMICPTVFRHNPYIHFERDEQGRLARLLQAREGDPMPEYGESDTGFFLFRAEPLRRCLGELRGAADGKGAATGEFNLLPVIPLAARSGMRVLTPHLMRLEETVGINSAADLAVVEAFLRSMYGEAADSPID